MLEIELKARVPDLQAVRERLISLNAELEGRVYERDLYLNAPHRDFAETDEALRIRDTNGRSTVTYKGAKKLDFRLKAREEWNCDVESGERMESIFKSLGFRQAAEVRKWREYYHYRDATICLDEVEGLGDFVEIELSDPESVEDPAGYVAFLAEELGIRGEPILSSYLELLLSAQHLTGYKKDLIR
jgi:adenylate cyclase class 2